MFPQFMPHDTHTPRYAFQFWTRCMHVDTYSCTDIFTCSLKHIHTYYIQEKPWGIDRVNFITVIQYGMETTTLKTINQLQIEFFFFFKQDILTQKHLKLLSFTRKEHFGRIVYDSWGTWISYIHLKVCQYCCTSAVMLR